MSNIVVLSGWGQANDSLLNVVPKEAVHFDYSNFTNIKDLFAAMKSLAPDCLVGWSLGGQLALRAISEEVCKPKALILIATPYQFVANNDIKCAMDKDTFQLFFRTFEIDHLKAIKRLILLIGKNDANEHYVVENLLKTLNNVNLSKWLYWLEQLESFSCNMIDFFKIPKTCAIHGRDDTIVDISQTGLFTGLIKNYRLETFDKCGHAPHLHNEQKTKAIITSFLEKMV